LLYRVGNDIFSLQPCVANFNIHLIAGKAFCIEGNRASCCSPARSSGLRINSNCTF
jgi:hypothetical protein